MKTAAPALAGKIAAVDRDLASVAGRGRQKGMPVFVVTEYPTGLTEEPTIVILKNVGGVMLLFCDTETWYKAPMTTMIS